MSLPLDSGVNSEIIATLDAIFEANIESGNDNYYHDTHRSRYIRTLEVLLSNNLGSNLLEIGTSFVIPLVLKKLAPSTKVSVTHFDLGMPTTGILPNKIGKFSINLDYMAVNLEETPLPVEPESFDSILCSEVLEHLDIDPMFMLSEINRVLKPGGVLILTTPNSCSTQALWKVLRGYEPYFYMQYHKDGSPYRHNYEYSKRTLKTVIESAGFSVDIWTENTFATPVLEDIEKINTLGYNLNLADMGDNLFVVAKKVSDVVDRYPAVIYV